MSKDNNRIINEMMLNAAVVADNKADYVAIVLEMYQEKNDTERVERLAADMAEMRLVAEILRKHGGCWA